MARDAHSRLVGWLKVILPLSALAILSTLFLVARTVDPDAAIPYSDVEIAERLREPRMTAPTLAGVTRDGATITVTAAEARPAEEAGTSASSVRARLETPDGAHTALSAGQAQADASGTLVTLDSGVLLSNSAGYEMKTEALQLRLDTTQATSTGPVEGFGPPGQIEAGGMEITEAPGAPGQYVLVFNGGVRLIYQPRNP
ncbi:lipopolysaccharide export system protein LptC [Gemmobacter caeni]|jgi:lipopolysaccharide export system protein LptC|uniref:Lipopolysaccharide export system protein LptC n=1 Tax=Gemmobacter caeni TaxID=589035 RepID=A0A2T6B3B9_9RHOB|nr:LPS export ABC transporter periplasmic protein LptC [Gemmobacter caeni]OJY32197.1 MAG: hypothetical protein BGP11_02150 [Rhodobacterales bacterium 65-51]PTX50523.1 lipopolysaccharide export system protein LptC [Gemmobacter caeni]TWI98260.1 lipopolysaccharide export system protein LptC [Gemmobacter caeni]